MTQADTCAHREVLGHRSRYTGKERDTESGNDYFDARYYSSSMGRFLSPDWSAQVSPVPYAKLDDPQTLNLYAYVGNNPLSRTDPTGHEIVQLGVHTDDEIKQETNEINKQLKVKGLSKEQKSALKAVKNTLSLEREGNHVAGAYLSALDSIGQRNGLQLSDIKLTSDSAHDFSSMGLSDAQTARIANPNTQAFVLNRSGSMYLKSETTLFQNTFSPGNATFMQDFGGTVLRHEQVHMGGGGEFAAYSLQRQIWQFFKNSLPADTFTQMDNQMQQSIQNNRDQ
jgi:RHS repeat-associated protein